MAENIKRADGYINSKKIVEMESSDFALSTNGEQQHGAEGVIGITTGNPEAEFTFNTIRLVNPKQGLQAIETAIQTQAIITLAYKMGTQLVFCACKCISSRYTSDSRTGTLKGTFVFRNAENPQYV